MTTTTNDTAAIPVVATVTGADVFIPLNKLKKHPNNVHKTPHSEASIEAKAASIHAKGILQNLVVEPELDAEGGATGFYLVSIGEGRRLAQLLRVKRKQIKKTELVRCVIDTVNDAGEISLDENVTREDLSPADQFERFRELAETRGWGAEEIAARFGVTAHVVRQRMRLGAVSPKLMQVYRDGGLTLEQLMAFAIVDDPARQEQVYENLSWNKAPSTIRRDLTRMHIAATDRRAIFVGAEAYTEAGGVILRDLFTEDRGGFYEDAALLDRLVIEKLEGIAESVKGEEGWKWSSVHIDYPHGNGLYRTLLPPGGRILDLMSSWVSHLPAEATYGAVVGHGLNARELTANPRLTRHFVQDLNADPILPLEDASIEAALICVGVQYLQDPVAVLCEVARVLVPGAPVVITFSNGCFPTKAVAIWRAVGGEDHTRLVTLYLRHAGFTTAETQTLLPEGGPSDPLGAVIGRTSPRADHT